jgi:hypothetical protein
MQRLSNFLPRQQFMPGPPTTQQTYRHLSHSMCFEQNASLGQMDVDEIRAVLMKKTKGIS